MSTFPVVALDSPQVPAKPEPVVTRSPKPWWFWPAVLAFGLVWLSFMGWFVAVFVTAIRNRGKAGALMSGGMVIVVRLVCGLFVGGGLCWMLIGVVPTFWHGANSHEWPTVGGVIEESSVAVGSTTSKDPKTGSTRSRTTYHQHLLYRYEVEGREYRSQRKQLGGQSSQRNREAAKALVRQDYVGKSVTVHYDPDDPSLAVLNPGVSEGAYVQLAISTAFMILGLLVAWGFGALPFVPGPGRRRTKQEN